MEKQYINRIFLVLLIFLSARAFGQARADSLKQKHSESVTIYGTSRPVIRQAYKINRTPQLPVTKSQPFNALRPFADVLFPTSISLQDIKPANIRTTINEENWRNFLILGVGSRMSPYAEFFHSAGKKNAYQVNFHLKHFSSFKNIKNYLPSPHSNSLAAFSYDKYFGYHVLGISVAYNLKTNRYYGYNTTFDTLPYSKNDSLLKQTYHKATLELDYSSTYKNFDKLHHHIKLAGTYFYDRYGTSEWEAKLFFDLHKAFRVTGVFDHQQLGVEGNYTFYKNQTKYQEHRDHFIRIMPYFDARYGVLSFKSGVNVEWLKLTQSAFHFYPYLRLNVNIIKNSFGVYGGVDGGMEKNSRARLTEENPYLNAFENDYLWQNTKWRYYAGLRGNIAKRLDFEFRAQRSSFENGVFFTYQSFFLAVPWYYNFSNEAYYRPFKNEFSLVYNNGKVSDFTGSLRWSNSSVLKLWLKGDYHQYKLDFSLKPYYKPLVEASFGVSFLVDQKIKPWAEVYYEGKRWAMKQPSGGIFPDLNYQMDAYVDINLGVNYQIQKQFSTFLRVTNLLNKQYFQFNDYPVAGLEVMVGGSYKF